MWQDFHFLSPEWFLALLPLGLLLWMVVRAKHAGGAWRRLINPHLLAVLTLDKDADRQRWWPLMLLGAAWIIAVTALANPTFERQEIPAFRTDAARVVVLDLSNSMLAADLTPTRIDRARYKVADILARGEDGQTGLVVFAGDAFAVSPLTDDADTIAAMLEVLSPHIMPVQGSRLDLAISAAAELLQQAGAGAGEVILLTDDAGDRRTTTAAEALRAAGHRLQVIGVGTAEGGVVPGVSTSQGKVVAKLDASALSKLARAGGGTYSPLTSNDADLNQVLQDPSASARSVQGDDPMLTETWKELGPWLVIALLPLGALAFRRGWVSVVVLLICNLSMISTQPARAFGWDDLWQREDQQAARALHANDYQRVLELNADPARIGAAHYRLGNYQAAASAYAEGDDAQHHYNRANALARAGQLEEAIAAYDEALAREPEMADALHNKEQIEKMLNRQRQQQSADGQDAGQQPKQDQDQSKSEQTGTDQANSEQASPDQSAASDADQQGTDGNQEAQDQSAPASSAAGNQGEQDRSQAPDGSQPQQQASGAQPAQTGAESSPDGSNASKFDGGRQFSAEDEQSDTQSAENNTADADGTDRAQAEQAAADYREQAAAAAEPKAEQNANADSDPPPPEKDLATDAGTVDVEPTAKELESRQATNQWLRRIPDDPAGLLRRKFLYQYRARAEQNGEIDAGKPW